MSLVERYRTFGWLTKKPELKQQLQAAVETLVQERDELKAQLGDLPEAQAAMLQEIKVLRDALTLAEKIELFEIALPARHRRPRIKYTTGHCEHNNQPGGCQLHNLQCGYPECDRKSV